MLRRLTNLILAVVLLCSFDSIAQTYQGPAQGSIDSGAVVNTNSFADFPISLDGDPIIKGEMNVEGEDFQSIILESDGKEIFPTTYVDDNQNTDNPNLVGDNAMLLEKFNVSLDNNVIPPDPTIAVGPNHVMVLTNNDVGIRIYDKQGNLLKSISSDSWWSAVWPSQSGDPQILYDHFANRWVMVFMQVDDGALTAGNLLAYSDDDDPLGTWYMYRLDTKKHGTVNTNTWGDYPQIGFDEQAIYIMTRCFSFGGGFNYTKIRIISKTELYASNAGPLTYKDLWDITIPGTSTRPDVIHPSFQYSAAGEHYLVYANRAGANFYTLYKIANPITSPTLTGVNINVPFYGPTPNANQLGGGSPLIEANGSHMKTSPVFRDGFLYATHSIRNSVYPNYASIKYIKINVATNSVVESAELGADRYFYIYPAIAVDKNGNVGITCSRSGDTEYIGSYFTTRRATDPAGLGNSTMLQQGLGNYIITFGGTRNRWGDYLGAFLDPADEYSFWMVSQYASGSNAYACAVGQVRLEPFEGIYIYQEQPVYDFGSLPIGETSDTLDVLITNYGSDALVISDIPQSFGDFTRITDLSFPLTLNTFDSLTINFSFTATVTGQQNIEYPVSGNDTSFTSINLLGRGYNMFPAELNTIYAISGTQNNGQTLTIDKLSGTGTNIGSSNYNDIISFSVNPKNRIIYGLRSNSIGSELLRVNSDEGDAYLLYDLSVPFLFSIAFDTSGVLYATTSTNNLYQIDLTDGSTTLVATLPTQRISIAFDNTDNELFGVVRNTIGTPKDRVIKIDPMTGDTIRLGQTGFGVNTTAITFDETGKMFGIKGTGNTISDLFSIDKTTGLGTIVGSVGLKDLSGVSYCYDFATGIEDISQIVPNDYALTQNFPNPFNPSTQINFALPVTSHVKLTVYNLLGETVKQLVTNEMSAGIHNVYWNSDDETGNRVSSGIYFYELTANGIDGSKFNQVRKMMLLK